MDKFRRQIDELFQRSESLDSITGNCLLGTAERQNARNEQEKIRRDCRTIALSGYVELGHPHFLELLDVL